MENTTSNTIETLPHKQVAVKVNAFVDERIAPLIEALSKIPNLVTEFSCEDNRAEHEVRAGCIPRAYVVFHAQKKFGDWTKLGALCSKVAESISEYDYAEVSIRWKNGNPVGILEFNTEDTYWLSLSINKYLEDWCLP